jgi:hypothetical protein
MLTDESIQQTYRLAYSLHPDTVVAWEITKEALKFSLSLSYTQEARPPAVHPYKRRLEEENLLRRSVFLASEKWEKDQESRAPKLLPSYRPTAEDLLFRYLKTLVMHSMDRKPVYAAVCIGGILYSYPTCEIAEVAADFFDDPNIRRVKCKLLNKVELRFSSVMVLPEGARGNGRPIPTERQHEFVNRSLATLAPSVSGHPTACAAPRPLLEEYFCLESERSDAERSHLILNPECGGWVRLVEEYNESQSDYSTHILTDPREKLQLPLFGGGFNGPNNGIENDLVSPEFDGRFDPEPLSPIEVRSLRQRFDETGTLYLDSPARFVA